MDPGVEQERGQRTVFMHIGCPKSGTSHVQARLSASPETAREQGLFWPMPWGRQVNAVRDLRAPARKREEKWSGAWTRVSREILAASQRSALISMEWLVGLNPGQIETCIRTLEPARLEVICTARDLLRTVPAHWQESTQNYRAWGWDDFVDAIVNGSETHPAGREFWRQHDVPRILDRWGTLLPWERIHLVTVPPQGGDRDLLWQRFCSVVGLQADSFPTPSRSNQSLGVQAARLMQQVNVAAQSRGIAKDVYMRHFKHALGKGLLAEAQRANTPIAVSAELERWLRSRADQLVKELTELPVHVVGDLNDLLPGKSLAGQVPSSVSDAEVLQTAVETIIDLLEDRVRKSTG